MQVNGYQDIDYLPKDEGIILPLYPENISIIPIKKLHVPENYHCRLNDILKLCDLITLGVEVDPIIVNDEFLIVDGVKRYYAFRRLQYEKIAVTKHQSIVFDNRNEFGILTRL